MNDMFMQNMHIIAGGNPQQTQQKQLSTADKQKISDAYFKMFYGLAFNNWMRGMPLGQAWYQALEQTKAFVTSKNANNPAAMYMKQIFAAHNTRWSQLIMTSPHKDALIKCPPEKRAEWTARAAKITGTALNSLNQTLAAYAPKQATTQQAPNAQFMTAQQKMQLILQWQMKQRQNGGMAA